MRKIILSMLLLLILTACGSPEEPDVSSAPIFDIALNVTSPAFTVGSAIPAEYTCSNADTSPELNWTDPPEGTLSFALIMDDPDAPARTWVHWVVYNIPADARSLPAGYTAQNGTLFGTNSWNRQDYGGPCPPTGQHRYFFKLYALDIVVPAEPILDKAGLLESIEGHVLAQGELMGVYEKP